MGAKKKVQVAPPPPQPPPEKNQNSILKIITSEGAQFKMNQELVTRFSPKIKSLAQNLKDGILRLQQLDGDCFEFIKTYIDMHSQKQPAKIIVPIRSNQSLKHIMEETDAQLVQKIMSKGDMFLQKMMDAALVLEMQPFRKRLACGVALKLMKSTIQQLKQEYGLDQFNFEQQSLRNGMRPLIEQLKKNYMEQET